MIEDLGLSGNELLAYAVIYGFSQDDKSKFYASSSYLAKWLGCTRRTVFTVLSSLVDKGLIEKQEVEIFGLNQPSYSCAPISQGMKKFHTPCEEISHPPVKNLHTPCEKFSPNNIEDNKLDNTSDNTFSLPTLPQTEGSKWCPGNQIPPDLESVREYVNDKNLDVNADEFFSYYNDCNWEANGERIRNWMSLLQSWAKRNSRGKPAKPSMNYEPVTREYMEGLMDRI